MSGLGSFNKYVQGRGFSAHRVVSTILYLILFLLRCVGNGSMVPKTKKRFELTDRQWSAINQYIPKTGHDYRRIDDREIVTAILDVIKNERGWYEGREDGLSQCTVYSRFHRWSGCPFWEKLVEALVKEGVIKKDSAAYFRVLRPKKVSKSRKRIIRNFERKQQTPHDDD